MTKQARIFSHGGSQAVRLPAEFRFTDVVLSQHAPRPYATFMAMCDALLPLPDAFLSPGERDQPVEDRDPFADSDSGGAER